MWEEFDVHVRCMMNLFWVFLLLPVVWSNDDLHRPEENVGVHDKNLFEGDMILPPAQRMAAMVGGDVSKAGIGRGSIRRNLWPGGVLVYYLDPALERSSSAMNAINAAMNQWRSKTCITFKKRTNERAYAHFHIGAGCTSYVGRTGSKQMLSLARGCWWTHTVAHEIGHALGFYHEQSRPDRDNYVNIYWNNIQKGLAFAFNKYPRSTIDSLGTPYDYKSVMHYESYAFSTNRRPTIQAKDSSITLSNRKGPTEIDYKQMNLLYKCSGGGDGGNGGGGGGGDGGNGGGGGGGDGGGSNCRDNHRSCPSWARRGECRKNPGYMLRNCKKSCDKC